MIPVEIRVEGKVFLHTVIIGTAGVDARAAMGRQLDEPFFLVASLTAEREKTSRSMARSAGIASLSRSTPSSLSKPESSRALLFAAFTWVHTSGGVPGVRYAESPGLLL